MICAAAVVTGLVAGLLGARTLPAGEAAGKAAAGTAPAKEEKTPDVVYVPTPHDVVEKMLELAGVRKGDVLYDLGCGDGRIVVAAAKKLRCRAVGFEIDELRVAEARKNVARAKVDKLATIEQKDVFTIDLNPASVVTLYLLPELNVKLIPQLQKLNPGSRIVSHDFDMKGVLPDKVLHMTSKEDNVEHTLYLFTTPLKKDPKAKKAKARP
jgi:SAM-dependent methyltransferase